MRSLTLSLTRLRRAVRAGQTVAAAWTDAGFENEWQAALVELVRIPAVERRMREKQTLERNGVPQAYGTPVPLTDLAHRLPGYLLPGWSSEPRVGWELAHAPSHCWNGLRRNLYVSLPEALYQLVTAGPDAATVAALWARWRTRVTGLAEVAP
jgi:hypothetical protein